MAQDWINIPPEQWRRSWALGWHNWRLDFGGSPFTALTFPG